MTIIEKLKVTSHNRRHPNDSLRAELAEQQQLANNSRVRLWAAEEALELIDPISVRKQPPLSLFKAIFFRRFEKNLPCVCPEPVLASHPCISNNKTAHKTLSVFLQERALPGTTNELRIAAEIEFNAADDAVNAAQFRCLALKRERSKMHFVRGRLRALAKLQWLMDQVQKPPLPAPLIPTMVVLPRQARDKHRKNFEKEIHFPTGQGPGARPERRAEEGLARGG